MHRTATTGPKPLGFQDTKRSGTHKATPLRYRQGMKRGLDLRSKEPLTESHDDYHEHPDATLRYRLQPRRRNRRRIPAHRHHPQGPQSQQASQARSATPRAKYESVGRRNFAGEQNPRASSYPADVTLSDAKRSRRAPIATNSHQAQINSLLVLWLGALQLSSFGNCGSVDFDARCPSPPVVGRWGNKTSRVPHSSSPLLAN